MKHRSMICSSRLRGATLIEVLAGLAILGSVAVALLLARGRLLEQQMLAMQKIEGVKLADSLLAGWYAQDAGVPIGKSGQLPDYPGWSWETQTRNTATQDIINSEVVQLQIFHHYDAALPTGSSGKAPIVVVDLLVPGTTE